MKMNSKIYLYYLVFVFSLLLLSISFKILESKLVISILIGGVFFALGIHFFVDKRKKDN